MKVKKMTVAVAVAVMVIAGNTIIGATEIVKGHLEVSYHPVPILEDSALAYTVLKRPSNDEKNCSAYTTVKIYNGNGEYKSGTYSANAGTAWDVPSGAGATAKIRAAKKAVGTHKAKSYDTNYSWLSTENTTWEK